MIYDYEYFKKEIYSLTTIDLNAYKEKQMKRRIDTLIAKHKIVGYDKYVQALKTDKVLFEEFVGYITINVSEFYRNPEQWKYLEETVIPELIQRFGKNLKVWSAACSTGDEPYSLVMALSRHIPLQQIRIYATDLDKQVIAKAKTGLYGEKSIEGVPEDLKKKYFTKIGPSYKIADEIKADEAGNDACSRLAELVPEGLTVHRLIPLFKDWNEVLQHRAEITDGKYLREAIYGLKEPPQEETVEIIRMSEVDTQTVEWLWEPYFPLGK